MKRTGEREKNSREYYIQSAMDMLTILPGQRVRVEDVMKTGFDRYVMPQGSKK